MAKPKRPRDLNLLARELVEELTGKDPKRTSAGRLGGKKGGPARKAKLTPERRREIAKKAAEARWHKK